MLSDIKSLRVSRKQNHRQTLSDSKRLDKSGQSALEGMLLFDMQSDSWRHLVGRSAAKTLLSNWQLSAIQTLNEKPLVLECRREGVEAAVCETQGSMLSDREQAGSLNRQCSLRYQMHCSLAVVIGGGQTACFPEESNKFSSGRFLLHLWDRSLKPSI